MKSLSDKDRNSLHYKRYKVLKGQVLAEVRGEKLSSDPVATEPELTRELRCNLF